MEDARLGLDAGSVARVTKQRAIIERGERLVREYAGRRRAVVASARHFDRLCRVVEIPLVADVRARIGLHLAGNFDVLRPRHAKITRQARLAHWCVCLTVTRGLIEVVIAKLKSCLHFTSKKMG